MITTFLLVIHIIVTLAMACSILAQKSEGGIGLGGSANMSLFTARGAANLLTRTTAILASIFLGNCILMSSLTNSALKQKSSLLDIDNATPVEINNEHAETPSDNLKSGKVASQPASSPKKGAK